MGAVFTDFSDEIVEALSGAAKYAAQRSSSSGRRVTIEVEFLALVIRCRSASGYACDHRIGWTEFYLARYKEAILCAAIDRIIKGGA